MSSKPFVCATHGHCFDGLASAALMRDVAEKFFPDRKFEIRACGYGSRQVRPTAEMFKGGVGAIVDFRYFPLDCLAFYFDHHRTAFGSEAERQHFDSRREAEPQRFVFNEDVASCTKLIADHAKAHFSLDFSAQSDLISWAHTIDSAAFSSAAAATDPDEPVLRLASVIEQFGDDALLTRAVNELRKGGLSRLAESQFIAERYRSIAPRQQAFLKQVESLGTQEGEVAYVDLGDSQTSAITKFVQYRLWPESKYSVMLTLMASGVRLSIGHNPWSGRDRTHDISKICARYGGGGHPMVGGIGLPKDDLPRARQIAREIVDELNR